MTAPRAAPDTAASHGRRAGLLPGLALLLLGLAVLSLGLGRYPIPVAQVIGVLAAPLWPVEHGWSAATEAVVLRVRLPRILMAALSGAALGMSGAALQALFRNPLAGPHVIGVSAGASFGGALALLSGSALPAVVGGAFASGLLAIAGVFALARLVAPAGAGGAGPGATLLLVLAGLIVSALFGALVGLTQFLADPESRLPTIVFWLLGSFATASAGKAALLAGAVSLAGLPLLGLRWRLNLLSLSEDEARSFGIRVGATRWLVLVLVTWLVASQVAMSGVIAWVGLVVPHLARLLAGPDHRTLLPAAALLGAAFLLLVDDLARSVSAAEIPIGILTALVGAPAFAVLLRRAQAGGGLGWSRGG